MGKNREWLIGLLTLAGALVLGQIISRLLAPASWDVFAARLPVILAMIAFWGPIVAIVAAAFVVITMRLLGFGSLAGIRPESVAPPHPAPAPFVDEPPAPPRSQRGHPSRRSAREAAALVAPAGRDAVVGFFRGAPGSLRADPAPRFRLPPPGH